MPNKPTFEMPEFKESDFNPNLKMSAMSVSTQPGIVWRPIENGKRYDCMRCGNTSTMYTNTKYYACDKCWVKYNC